MTETPPQGEPAAPAPAPADQVTIALGPDLGIYPEELRPAETPPPAPAAPDAAPPEPPAPAPTDAGPVVASPQQGDAGQEQGSRRQRGQDAYERGLAEGRAAVERERAEADARAQASQQANQATERVEALFAGLESTDPLQQAQARQGILQLYRGNQQASAIGTTVRQQILMQMAADFGKLKGADGVDDQAYEQLHTAANPVELVQRAMALGRKSRDDDVARLEAELTQLRGRLLGRTATPEPGNGNAGGASGISWDTYINMSPQEARKLTPRQIDAITAEHARELAASSNGHL